MISTIWRWFASGLAAAAAITGSATLTDDTDTLASSARTQVYGYCPAADADDALTCAGVLTIDGGAALADETDGGAVAGTVAIDGAAALADDGDTLLALAVQPGFAAVALVDADDSASVVAVAFLGPVIVAPARGSSARSERGTGYLYLPRRVGSAMAGDGKPAALVRNPARGVNPVVIARAPAPDPQQAVSVEAWAVAMESASEPAAASPGAIEVQAWTVDRETANGYCTTCASLSSQYTIVALGTTLKLSCGFNYTWVPGSIVAAIWTAVDCGFRKIVTVSTRHEYATIRWQTAANTMGLPYTVDRWIVYLSIGDTGGGLYMWLAYYGPTTPCSPIGAYGSPYTTSACNGGSIPGTVSVTA